ncbi:MAG: hypothetical protein RR816_10975, partial [Clostridia bacterium]
RKSGARGLRAIIEKLLMESMFEIPSRNDVKQCIISEKCVQGKEKPKLVKADGAQLRRQRNLANAEKKAKSNDSGNTNESSVS